VLHRRGDLVAEICGDARAVELELAPLEREHAGCDRAARHARDDRELLQPAGIVETPHRTEVEQRRAETTP
jgi:hypothetical protein